MRKNALKKMIALVLMTAMLVGIMPQMQLFVFAASEDGYEDISGTTYQIPWEKETTSYVARRSSSRFVGVGSNSIFESAGYSRSDYPNVRSAKFSTIKENGYFYHKGVVITDNKGSADNALAKDVPGIATLFNMASPLVVGGFAWDKDRYGESYRRQVASGLSHPGISDPLDNSIFTLDHYSDPAVNDATDGYGYEILVKLLAATYLTSAWFSVKGSSDTYNKNFTLWSGADYAYQLGSNQNGTPAWFAGYTKVDGKERAYANSGQPGSDAYWESCATFIKKSWYTLQADKQIGLPGLAQGNSSKFPETTANGIKLNNKQGVENVLHVNYARPVMFATTCQDCFNEYYHNRGMDSKALVTGGSGYRSGEVISTGNSSNNYMTTLKKVCSNPLHKNTDYCYIWLIPGTYGVSAPNYDPGASVSSATDSFANNSTSTGRRYVTWAHLTFNGTVQKTIELSGATRLKRLDTKKFTGYYENKTLKYDENYSGSIIRYGAGHYNSDKTNIDEYYQLALYEVKTTPPDIYLYYYVNGSRAYTYKDSDGNPVTYNLSNADHYAKEAFTSEQWQNKATLSIGPANDYNSHNDYLKKLNLPVDANVGWYNVDKGTGSILSGNAASTANNVNKPGNVLFSVDATSEQIKDVTATNITANTYNHVYVPVNITFDGTVTINYLNANDGSALKSPVTIPFLKNEKGEIPYNIAAYVDGQNTTFKYKSYTFRDGASDVQACVKVTKPTSSNAGSAKVTTSRNKKINIDVYYEPAEGQMLTMEFYREGISASQETAANYLQDAKQVSFKKGNEIGYPDLITKNGQTYQFVRYDQNGISETYVKQDAANRKVVVQKDGKSFGKVKAYYRESVARSYTIHLVRAEAGKTLDQCSELYSTGKKVLPASGTLTTEALNTSGISALSGYTRDTSTAPIDIHASIRNSGSVTGTTSIVYTGTTIVAGYDYDIYIPYKVATKANKYTIYYTYNGSALWSEGPFSFESSDAGKKKSVNITVSKSVGGIEYEVDTTNTTDRYDRHNGVRGTGVISGSAYTTANAVESGYDYEIYIPLRAKTNNPEYWINYYKGSTSNILYSAKIGDVRDGDIGKKKVINWGGTSSKANALEVSFPSSLVADGYHINYSGMGYDKRNGYMEKGDLDGSSTDYTTKSVIEGKYRYDIYIPVISNNAGWVNIRYEYVDADDGYKPLWKKGVYIPDIPMSEDVSLQLPNAYKTPQRLPQDLRAMGWELAAEPRAWVSTSDPNLYNKYWPELNGNYEEFPIGYCDGGYVSLPETIEWQQMIVLIPLRNAQTANKNVRIFYYVQTYDNVYVSETNTRLPKYTILKEYNYDDVANGTQQFTLDKYITVPEKIESSDGNGYGWNQVLEASYLVYPSGVGCSYNGIPPRVYHDLGGIYLNGREKFAGFSGGGGFPGGGGYYSATSCFCEQCENYTKVYQGSHSGTMHHSILNTYPIEDPTTTMTVDGTGKKITYGVNVFSEDTQIDIYVLLVPRQGFPMTIYYFEDGNPNHIVATENVEFDSLSEFGTNIATRRTGGVQQYAYWQSYEVPTVVKEGDTAYWEPAYTQLSNPVDVACPWDGRQNYNYVYKSTYWWQGTYSMVENHYFYCTCGAEVGYYWQSQYSGSPLQSSSGNVDHPSEGGTPVAPSRNYSTFQNEIRMFYGEGTPVYQPGSDYKWEGNAWSKNEPSGKYVKHNPYSWVMEACIDSTPYAEYYYDHGEKIVTYDTSKAFLYIKDVMHSLPNNIENSSYTTDQYSTSTDTTTVRTNPGVNDVVALFVPCKRANASSIDVRYVTLNANGDVDQVVYEEKNKIVIRQGDTDFSYEGPTTMLYNDRRYTVTGSGQVLAYADASGYASYKNAAGDATNTKGQAVSYSATGGTGKWTSTKPYQPYASITTDGVIYIPVAADPDLTVKVRYVVYGTNTVLKEDTLTGLATEKDIAISVPAELSNGTEAFIPMSDDNDFALYGKETASFFGITYQDGVSIRNGTPRTGYAYEQVLSLGAGKVHVTIPFTRCERTNAVVYIPYEPSTTKVDVKYITIREDGTWRHTIRTENEVEIRRGNHYVYQGARRITLDGWNFEVMDSVEPRMSYNGASYDAVRGNPGSLGQRLNYDGLETWSTTEKINVERATIYIPVQIYGHTEAEGDENGTDPAVIPDATDDYGTPGLTVNETSRQDGLQWGNWVDDPLRPVPDRTSGGLTTARDNAYAYVYHNTYSVSDAIPSGTNTVKGAINTYPFLAGATYSVVRKSFNYHIRNTINFVYDYYTATGFDWSWTEDDVEDESGFHKKFEGYITLPTIERHTDTVPYSFGFDISGESQPYVTDIRLSVASLNGGQITNGSLDRALTIGAYSLGKTQKTNGSFAPQNLSRYDYTTTRYKTFSAPVLNVRGGLYTDKQEFLQAVNQVKAFISSISGQPGEVRNAANQAYADAKVNPAQAEAQSAAANTTPSHAQLWVNGTNYATASGTVNALSVSRATYDTSNSANIPAAKANGEYASSFTTDYRYVINEMGLPEVDPSGRANPVYVHTPVYTSVTVGCDNKKYEQTKDASLPNFLLVNGTSDSYGSAGKQNITNDFTLTVGNAGQHLTYPGYGNRDYSGYLMTNGNQVAFDCDMWMDVGNDGNPANDMLLPASTWACIKTGSENNKGVFYLPEWIKDGSHEYFVRTVAYNNPAAEITTKQIGAYAQQTVNTERTFNPSNSGSTAAYLSYIKGTFTVVGKLYGLTLADVDDTAWKNVFHAAGSEVKLYRLLGKDAYAKRIGLANANTSKDGTGISHTAQFDKTLAYYYKYGTNNELGLNTGREVWSSLPTLKGYNPSDRATGTLNAGHTWTFKVDTVGTETVTDKAQISVEPSFRWISSDGKTWADVKLYYSETTNGKKYTLTKVGSASDTGNVKKNLVGNMQMSLDELKLTAKIKGYGIEGGPKLSEYLGLEGETQRYGKFITSSSFKTFSNLNYYDDIKGRGIAQESLATGTLRTAVSGISNVAGYLARVYGTEAKAQTALSKLKQSYYFTYSIPSEFYVYPSNKTPETLKDLKKEKMNDSGYLVVNFRIHSVIDGKEYLYYWDGNHSMWNLETGVPDLSSRDTIKRTDSDRTEFTICEGDVALIEIRKEGNEEIGTVLK